MHGGKKVAYEILRHIECDTVVNTILHKVVVSSGLHYGHTVLALVSADVTGHGHTLCKEFEQFVINPVNLFAQNAEAFEIGRAHV